MPDDMRRRRNIAAAAFAARRRELQLTQEQVAQRGDIVVRSVQNFESQGRWPNARTRASLERAVEWPAGEIERVASGQTAGDGGAPLLAAIDRLQAELDQLREEYRRSQATSLEEFLRRPQPEGNGHDGGGSSRASLPA